MVLFTLGDEQLYGINVFKTKEIVEMPLLSDVPDDDARLLGIAVSRDEPIVFIDLNVAIKKPPFTLSEDEIPKAIVAEFNGGLQGFKVEQVHKIVRVDWSECKPPPAAATSNSYLNAVVVVDGQLVEVLDLEKIFHDVGKDEDSVLDLIPLELPEGVDLDGKSVLIVDDSSLVRKKTKVLVEALGLECLVCADGKDALEIIAEIADKAEAQGGRVSDKLLLVVTDIEMPHMDGLALVESVKANPLTKDLCMVIHSSISGGGNLEHAKGIGANEYLVKWNEKSLVEMIKNRVEGLC